MKRLRWEPTYALAVTVTLVALAFAFLIALNPEVTLK